MERRYFDNPYQDFDQTSPGVNNEASTQFIKGIIDKNVNLILAKENPQNLGRADIYVGLSGIAFMFLKLSQSSLKEELKLLQPAKLFSEGAETSLKTSRSCKLISLLAGDAGVHIVSAAVNKSCNKSYEENLKSLLQGLSIYENPEYLDGADEMLVGRSGYLLGLLSMASS